MKTAGGGENLLIVMLINNWVNFLSGVTSPQQILLVLDKTLSFIALKSLSFYYLRLWRGCGDSDWNILIMNC